MEIALMRLKDNAVIPTYGSQDAAGADLYACLEQEVYIPFGKTMMIPTGLAIAIPKGYVGLIFARSGLSCKHGLAPANKVGVIDADYRGEILVALHNHDQPQHNTDYETYMKEHTIHSGDRIAQIAFLPYQTGTFQLCEELPESQRGNGGFGSTGK